VEVFLTFRVEVVVTHSRLAQNKKKVRLKTLAGKVGLLIISLSRLIMNNNQKG